MQRSSVRLNTASLPLAPDAEEEQLADLIGGEGEIDVLLGKPGVELTRGGELEFWLQVCSKLALPAAA